jgi:hypothetical protein
MKSNIASFRRPACARNRHHRSGLMIVAALVCLLVVTSIVGSMLKGALRARRELHTERDRRQTELLIDAGADRAVARLAAELDFRGDTWEILSTAIVGRGGGRVTTEISLSTDQQFRRVRVVAEYPLGGDFPIRRSRTFHVANSMFQSQE